MQSHIHVFMEELVQRYEQANIPNHFSIEQVDTILRGKYLATPTDIEMFADLKHDPYVDFENIVGAYAITNQEVLSQLLSANEKISLYEFIRSLEKKEEDLDNDSMDGHTGRRIDIILESKDGTRLTGFTVQGLCDKLVAELAVMKGIDVEECILGNEQFYHYLRNLLKAQYI
jgi:hypothetical protein